MKTNENLATAFAGESQANRKYLCFAAQAEKEGFSSVARLFRATAEAETIHAFAEFKAKGGIGTAENLVAPRMKHEFTEMYPPMIEDAKAEGNTSARIFNYANEAEGKRASTKRHWQILAMSPRDRITIFARSAAISTKAKNQQALPDLRSKTVNIQEILV